MVYNCGGDADAACPGDGVYDGIWAAWRRERISMAERAYQDLQAHEVMDLVRARGATDLVVDGTEYQVTDAWTEATWVDEDRLQVLMVALWYGRDYLLLKKEAKVRVYS